MSASLCDTLPTLQCLRVYWRTHDAGGEIPLASQTWWAACYDRDGLLLAMTVDEDLIAEANTLADLVVAVGEELLTLIGVDQVKIDTGHRTAEWNRGS